MTRGVRKVRWPRHAACGCFVYTGSWIILRDGLWICRPCALAAVRATTTEGAKP